MTQAPDVGPSRGMPPRPPSSLYTSRGSLFRPRNMSPIQNRCTIELRLQHSINDDDYDKALQLSDERS